MNSLYNHKKVKAMISFTKAEGFGRPLLEFCTTGKLIIAPHYSGQTDFLHKDLIIALPGGLTEIHPSARNPFLIEGAKWFTPDYGFAKKAMREIHKHYNKFIELGKKQKKIVLDNFTKKSIKQQYEKVFTSIDETVSKIPGVAPLQMPKLNLPKIENKTPDVPKLKLPSLKKVDA